MFTPPESLATAASGLRDFARATAVALYATAQAGLTLYAAHRYAILLGRRDRSPAPREPAAAEPGRPLPRVTVQLPVYNERRVVERLIAAAASLEYPADRLEIQVLDDSTDETAALAAVAVARARARGVDIVHVRRRGRTGFKAGALAHGLSLASGEFVAVFDADFVPPPDFLRRTLGHFVDPRVGMVQARWGHLNRSRSALTVAQAVLLDAHFVLEHVARMRRGLFFNFNGTAGVWRRRCIEEAGGWSHDTLTEDLDLSYRAQLAGWRFVFDSAVAVPAELPADMEAFKSQQRRWTKGSIQTARKILPALWRSGLPLRVKLEALVHLTSNAAYPLLLAVGLLLLPVMLGRPQLPAALLWALQVGIVLLGVVPVSLFLAAGQRELGLGPANAWRGVPAALVLGIGLSLNNARAVLEGLGGRVGEWERTPKTGEATAVAPPRGAGYARARGVAGWGEALLALYFSGVFAWSWGAGQARALPFLALLIVGFAWVARGSLIPAWPVALPRRPVAPGR